MRKLRLSSPRHSLPKATQAANDAGKMHWSALIANLSQVAMLLLVTFGYFYTVRPVDRLGLLEEKTAKLELEASDSAKEIAESRGKLQSLAAARDGLASTNAALRREQAKLETSVSQLGSSATALRADLINAETSTSLQRSQIRDGQRTLLLQIASFRWWRDTINDQVRGSIFYKADEGDTLAKWAAEPTPPQPADRVIAVIDEELSGGTFFGLPEPHDISRSLLLELRAGVDGARDRLACPSVDRRQWVKGWETAKAAYDHSLPECTDWLMKRTAAREGWTPAELEAYLRSASGKRDMTSSRISCETSAGLHQKMQFVRAWDALQKPCTDRLMYADNVGLGSHDALAPFPDLSPPTWEPAWYLESFPK